MTAETRYRQMDAARTRAELSVQDVWLRYLALGGTGDAFDLDGYLQGLTPLEAFQEDVLAQSLNEALRELYLTHRIPLSTLEPADGWDDERLGHLMARLLDDPAQGARRADEPRSAPSP